MYSVNKRNIDIELPRALTVKIYHDAVSDRMITFGRVLELAQLRADLIAHDKLGHNGGLLHIVTEDGNYEDSNIDYCLEQLRSDDWKSGYWGDVLTAEDIASQLCIAERLRELTVFERECVVDGTTMVEDLYNFLMNGDPSGITGANN